MIPSHPCCAELSLALRDTRSSGFGGSARARGRRTVGGPSGRRAHRREGQVAFGINVAQRGLWREAIYRWEKAVEIDPTYAAAYNDLAIAYEHEGQLDKARKAYEKALELEPDNAADSPELRAVQGNQ